MNKKPNFIQLIGSDGAGKTTIAEALNEVFGYSITHFGPPKDHEDGYNQYFNFVRDTKESVICDRFHEGEKIFAPLYRGYEANYFPKLETEMKYYFKPLLVLVYAPFEVIEKRLNERGEDFVKPEHFEYCFEKVLEVFNESELPKMMIDTSKLSVENNVEKIVKKIVL